MYRFTQEDHIIINSRLDAIEEQNKREFAAIKAEISNNRGLLRSLMSGQGRSSGRIDELTKDVGLLHGRVVSLEHALDDLRADFDAFTPTVGPEIDDKLKPLERQIAAMKDQMNIMFSEVSVLSKGVLGNYQVVDNLGHDVGGVAGLASQSTSSLMHYQDRFPENLAGTFALSTGVGYTFVGTAQKPLLRVENFMQGNLRMRLSDTALMYGGSDIPLIQQSLLQIETTVPPGPADWSKLPAINGGVLWLSLVAYEGVSASPIVVMRKVNATVTVIIIPDKVGRKKLNFLLSLDEPIKTDEHWNGMIIHGGDFPIIL
nr:sigma 1 protein [Piscine orthoreovirus]